MTASRSPGAHWLARAAGLGRMRSHAVARRPMPVNRPRHAEATRCDASDIIPFGEIEISSLEELV